MFEVDLCEVFMQIWKCVFYICYIKQWIYKSKIVFFLVTQLMSPQHLDQIATVALESNWDSHLSGDRGGKISIGPSGQLGIMGQRMWFSPKNYWS